MTDPDEWSWIDDMTAGWRLLAFVAFACAFGAGVLTGLGLALWRMVG